MMNDAKSETLVTWHTYEPANGIGVELSENDLVQHVLLAGSTGCGKTTLLTDAARQLVRHNPRQPDQKIGLLILDAKADQLIDHIRDAAVSVGREKDIIVFGPDGDATLDLFGSLRSFDDVDRVARRMLLATDPLGLGNAYWQQAVNTMVQSGLALLLGTKGPSDFATTIEFLRSWFFTPNPPHGICDLIQENETKHPALVSAFDHVRLWEELDMRTKTNVQSCLIQVMQPLFSSGASKTFGSAKRIMSPVQCATEGMIAIGSLNALGETGMAKVLFRLLKQDFFDAVQQRRGTAHRLCGLLADELPLVVTASDVEQLATVRSKRCFVIAGTQNLLSERLGISAAHSLINNFGTTVFMRSRDAETAVMAHVGLGNRIERPPFNRKKEEAGDLLLNNPPVAPTSVPVCPVGTLARLAPHQAFVLHADGRRTEHAVWFAPWFEHDLANRRRSPFSAEHTRDLMKREGFKQIITSSQLARALKSIPPASAEDLERVTNFFRSRACRIPDGFDKLPGAWLKALPGILWSMRKPHWTHLPFFIDRLAVDDGILLINFVQEEQKTCDRITAWDRIRIRVNAGLYPSSWKSLKRAHAIRSSSLAVRLEM